MIILRQSFLGIAVPSFKYYFPILIPMKPLDLIHESLEKRVIVELRGNREYRGILEGYDHPHLNLVLKKVEEFINGKQTRTVEQIMVRGDNIIYISP